MRLYFRKIVPGFAVAAVLVLSAGGPAAAQSSLAAAQTSAAAQNKIPTPGQFPAYKAPHTADGKPDFSGIWQAFVTADIDVQDHDAQAGPHPDFMGAYGAWPGGQGIVEGGRNSVQARSAGAKKGQRREAHGREYHERPTPPRHR